MSHITSYPNSLKQLDLSHNKISCWPSLPQIDSTDPMELAAVTCYCPDNATAKSHLGKSTEGYTTGWECYDTDNVSCRSCFIASKKAIK
jgi:hypothetical protein